MIFIAAIILLILLVGVSIAAYQVYVSLTSVSGQLGDLDKKHRRLERDYEQLQSRVRGYQQQAKRRDAIFTEEGKYAYKVLDGEDLDATYAATRRLLQVFDYETKKDELGELYCAVLFADVDPRVELVFRQELPEERERSGVIPFAESPFSQSLGNGNVAKALPSGTQPSSYIRDGRRIYPGGERSYPVYPREPGAGEQRGVQGMVEDAAHERYIKWYREQNRVYAEMLGDRNIYS